MVGGHLCPNTCTDERGGGEERDREETKGRDYMSTRRRQGLVHIQLVLDSKERHGTVPVGCKEFALFLVQRCRTDAIRFTGIVVYLANITVT